MVIRIGLIADTHGLFDPAVRGHFQGVDCIIHAGDIGDHAVLDELKDIAPVVAVSGNVDDYERSGLPSEAVINLGGRCIAVRHIIYEGGKLTKEGRDFLERTKPDICVFGHTHQPKIDRVDRTLMINPGSAGPKRFTLPRGIGFLELRKTGVRSVLIRLRHRVLRRRTTQEKLS